MPHHLNSNILIVGGGPVGVFAAQRCAAMGLTVILADAGTASKQPATDLSAEPDIDADPRVYALSSRTVAMLESAGLWHDVPDACPYHSMEVWDRNGIEHIRLEAADAGLVQLGFIIHHKRLMRLLMSGLAQNLRLLENESLASLELGAGRARAGFASGATVTADLVIGADGATSKTRTLARLPVRQWPYEQIAYVATAELSRAHQGVARQVFTEFGPLGILPVGEPQAGHVVLIWSMAQEQAKKLESMSDDKASDPRQAAALDPRQAAALDPRQAAALDPRQAAALDPRPAAGASTQDRPQGFRAMLAHALEIKAEQIKKLGRPQQFPLTHCHAKTWVAPGLALVGDAAHSIHPLAGQGLNLGFEDVVTLTDLLKSRRQSQAKPTRPSYPMSLLRRYQYSRRLRTYSMIALTESMNSCFRQSGVAATVLRNRLLALANRSDFIKTAAIKIASGYG